MKSIDHWSALEGVRVRVPRNERAGRAQIQPKRKIPFLAIAG